MIVFRSIRYLLYVKPNHSFKTRPQSFLFLLVPLVRFHIFPISFGMENQLINHFLFFGFIEFLALCLTSSQVYPFTFPLSNSAIRRSISATKPASFHGLDSWSC